MCPGHKRTWNLVGEALSNAYVKENHGIYYEKVR